MIKEVFIAFVIVICMLGCNREKSKKNIPTNLNEESFFETLQIEYEYNQLMELEIPANKIVSDPIAIFKKVVDKLRTNPLVEEIDLNETYAHVFLKSGRSQVLFIDLQDQNGVSLTRGSNKKNGSLKKLGSTDKNRKLIKNKQVLFLNYIEEFYSYSRHKTLDSIKAIVGRQAGFSIDLRLDEESNYNYTHADIYKIDSISKYGMTILSTHGAKHGIVARDYNLEYHLRYVSPTKPLWYFDKLDPKTHNILSTDSTYDIKRAVQMLREYDGAIAEGLFDGTIEPITEHGFKFNTAFNWEWTVKYIYEEGVLLTTKYLQKHIGNLQDAVFFNSSCYSGESNNGLPDKHGFLTVRDFFVSKNPAAYYCYVYNTVNSAPVTNNFSREAEEFLLRSLISDNDTTGEAHLNSDGSKLLDNYWKDAQLDHQTYLEIFLNLNYWFGCFNPDLIDSRDGNIYKTVCLNEKLWMAENLRYYTGGSLVYNNDITNEKKHGRLYSWNQIMAGASSTNAVPSAVRGLCPKGWHIPSAFEWLELINYLDGENVAGGKLKSVTNWDSPNTGGTNTSGFNAFASGSGYSDVNSTTFNNIGKETSFWSTYDDPDGAGVYFLFLHYSSSLSDIRADNGSSSAYSDYRSCRCLKD